MKLRLDLDALAGVLAPMEVDTALLVVDRTAYEVTGADQRLRSTLRGIRLAVFHEFEPNPSAEATDAGMALCRSIRPDIVIALGGGSAIDMGKLIRAGIATRAQARDLPHRLAEGNVGDERTRIPLVAVPTTAGSGAEATHFAVLYVDRAKRSVAHESVRPDVAILDWRLTMSAPPEVAAAAGLDALCHSIESLWSTRSTAWSRRRARRALRTCLRLLPAAVAGDRQARMGMTRAAHAAGRAIDVSLTTASHALAYHLTTAHGVPHGFAVAQTIGSILEFNAGVTDTDCTDPRGAVHVRRMVGEVLAALGARTPPDARARLEQLIRDLGGPVLLEEIGVESADVPAILASVNAERLGNNPRWLPAPVLRELFQPRA